LDSFKNPLLFINYLNPVLKNGYINCIIEKLNEKTYHIKNEEIELYFTSQKKPLLEGGEGFIDFDASTTYYYSLTNLQTTGKIKIKDEWIEVSGKSWMDHQWAQKLSEKNEWDWFSIQLENNVEIVCFRYGNEKVRVCSADISYPNGKQKNFKNIEITPKKETWKSPVTKAVYPTSWQIKIPEEGIDLHLKARVKNQEMLFGAMSYWEGPSEINGMFENKKIRGRGFMELVGYPSQYNNVKYIRDEIKKTASRFLANVKK
jgi:predicted secreted hydrolase